MDTLTEIQEQYRQAALASRAQQRAKAYDYLVWYAEYNNWTQDELDQVADMLGLPGGDIGQEPRLLHHIPTSPNANI